MALEREPTEEAEHQRSEELLRRADELVDLAKEVRDDMRRITTLYEERQYGHQVEKRAVDH